MSDSLYRIGFSMNSGCSFAGVDVPVVTFNGS
jgi:hypothetical protein